jgi:hypothetical protein
MHKTTRGAVRVKWHVAFDERVQGGAGFWCVRPGQSKKRAVKNSVLKARLSVIRSPYVDWID